MTPRCDPHFRMEVLTTELAQLSSRHEASGGETTQSAATLNELLKGAKEGWAKAAANLLAVTANSSEVRAEIAGSAGAPVFQAEQSARASVQSLVTPEQAKVAEL